MHVHPFVCLCFSLTTFCHLVKQECSSCQKISPLAHERRQDSNLTYLTTTFKKTTRKTHGIHFESLELHFTQPNVTECCETNDKSNHLQMQLMAYCFWLRTAGKEAECLNVILLIDVSFPALHPPPPLLFSGSRPWTLQPWWQWPRPSGKHELLEPIHTIHNILLHTQGPLPLL